MRPISEKFASGGSERMSQVTGGFTLIETLMALFVLMVGVLAGFAVISQAIHTSPLTRQQLIAASFAQEAIEIFRNVRDQQLLAIADKTKQGIALSYPSDSWSNSIKACPTGGASNYRNRPALKNNADISSGWFTDKCNVAGNWDRMYQEGTTGFFANLCIAGSSGCGSPPANWQDTGFRRGGNVEKYICTDASCTGLTPDNSCDTSNTCHEMRVWVIVYWNTDVEPTTCPADNCIIVEDRFTNWVDYMQSFL